MRTLAIAAAALYIAGHAAYAQSDEQRENSKALVLEQFRASAKLFTLCAMSEATKLALRTNEKADVVARTAAERCDTHLQKWRSADMRTLIGDGSKTLDEYRNKFIETRLRFLVDIARNHKSCPLPFSVVCLMAAPRGSFLPGGYPP